MRLVEEERDPRLFGVAHLGQLLEQFRQQPQKERGIQARRLHQPVRRKDVDHAFARRIDPHQVRKFQRGLTEQPRSALRFQHQQRALDRPDRRRRDVAVAQPQVGRVLAHPDQHRLEVGQVQNRQPLLVRDVEGDVHHPFLRGGEVQQPRQQQRPHFGGRAADRVPLFAEHVPEGDGERLVVERHADRRRPVGEGLDQLGIGPALQRHAGKVALHVGQEHRHPGQRQRFGQRLQGDRLAGAGRARDQPVAVGVFQQHPLGRGMPFAAAADMDGAALQVHDPRTGGRGCRRRRGRRCLGRSGGGQRRRNGGRLVGRQIGGHGGPRNCGHDIGRGRVAGQLTGKRVRFQPDRAATGRADFGRPRLQTSQLTQRDAAPNVRHNDDRPVRQGWKTERIAAFAVLFRLRASAPDSPPPTANAKVKRRRWAETDKPASAC